MAKGKGSGSAPPIPDARVTAAAATSSNVDTAIAQQRMNMMNQSNPYGSMSYAQVGSQNIGGKEVPFYQSSIVLSPAQQEILDRSNQLNSGVYKLGNEQLGRVSSAIGKPIDYGGMPAAPTADEAGRQRVEDALYGRATATLDPQYQERQKSLETKLANTGFARGSAGYSTAMDDYTRQRDAAYEAARQDSIAGGGAEQSRLFGLGTTARANAIAEYMAQRNAPINELAALLGTGSGVSVPQFSAAPQTGVSGVDVAGMVNQQYGNQVAQYNQQQDQQNALFGSLFGLGGKALGAWLG